MVSLLLIGIAAWGIGFGLISSLRVVGVVIAVGIFLFLIALVGLIGAVKHHQVLLFFYMIILLLVFIVQFSVSCACLALNQEQQVSQGFFFFTFCFIIPHSMGKRGRREE